MKSLSVLELNKLCLVLQKWQGFQLQEVIHRKKDIYFNFFGQGKSHWLLVSMSASCPLIFPISTPPRKEKKQTTPLSLFIKANIKNKILNNVFRDKDYGRVICMEFSGVEGLYSIEFRLFPHGQNIKVLAGKKSISLHPLKELQKSKRSNEASVEQMDRDLVDIEKEYFKGAKSGLVTKAEIKETLWSKQLSKLNKAIKKTEEDLLKKRGQQWDKLARQLQESSSLNVEVQWQSIIDKTQSLSWNINNCFEKHKKTQVKIKGQESRLEELITERDLLEANGPEDFLVSDKKSLSPVSPKGAKYRRKNISKDCSVIVGRSAKENLSVLRAAKAWDIWLHIKDYPSAHGIIQRAKKHKVSDKDLDQAVQFLFQVNFGKKYEKYKNQSFEVLVAESRYVRPIKGDKLGRVNYHSEKVIRFVCK